MQDLRYAWRALRRHKGLSAVVILTLALAIGANTAIFSLMDGLLFKALPVRNPQGLLLMSWSSRGRPGFHSMSSYGDCANSFKDKTGSSGCTFSVPFFKDVQTAGRGLSLVTAMGSNGIMNLGGNGAASMLHPRAVAGNFFATLGLVPAAGRLLQSGDDQPASPLALVLSYQYWQTAFGGATSVVGKTVTLNNVPVTIVGVAEHDFPGLTPGRQMDGWIPLSALPRLDPNWRPHRLDADYAWLVLLARLRPGVSVASAQAELSAHYRTAMLAGPKPMLQAKDAPAVSLAPAQSALTGARGMFREPLVLLLATAGAILLIACANIAGLLVGRARARDKEIAVRRALGAGRWRLLRQLLVESLLLAFFGGMAGLALAAVAAPALRAWITPARPFAPNLDAPLDARVLLFALAITLVTGLLFGVAPGLGSGRLDLAGSLKDGTGNSSGRHGWLSLGNALVVAQVALCVVVLSGAGLMLRTLTNLRSIEPGFDTSNLLLFNLSPDQVGYKGVALQSLYQRLHARLSTVPGVVSVSHSESPLLAGDLSDTDYKIAARPSLGSVDSDVMPIGLGFFANLKIPLLRGRDLVPSDFQYRDLAPGAQPPPGPPTSVIVNQEFVRKYLAGLDPLGQTLSQDKRTYTVVGVAGNAKYQDLRSAILPTVYEPSTEGFAAFELRTAVNPMSLLPEVRRAVSAVDQRLPILFPTTQQQSIDGLLYRERMLANLSTTFAGLALLLAAIGLYALLAQEVTRRTREIGIRMALGAARRQVLAMILGAGAALAVVGLAAGTLAAWGVTRYLKSFLYGVAPVDPLTLAAAGLLLLAVALAACYLPARRATRVDPLQALRCE